MNATSKTKTSTSKGAEQQTFIVLGVLLQFLSTPEQINDQISVMRGTVPSGVVFPLHSHADPEIFYVLNGSLEVFQAEGSSEGWQTVTAEQVVSIPGNVRHALRNTSPRPITLIIVSKQELYSFVPLTRMQRLASRSGSSTASETWTELLDHRLQTTPSKLMQ